MNIRHKFSLVAAVLTAFLIASCSKTESYSDLLKKEQKASNWFLAQHKVCNEIPADSVFVTGQDAPYYKMDPDGYVYMQVVSCSPLKDRDLPKTGDQVYFTYLRKNIDTMYANNTLDIEGSGNLIGSTYFIFNNYSVQSSYEFGSGMQIPVSYLGYNSEVNILLKSYYGFYEDNTLCIPYQVNVRYFKAEY